LLVGVLGATAIACAGGRPSAAPGTDTRPRAEGPEPTTVEEAQADIDRWRQVLLPAQASTTTLSPSRAPSADHAPSPTTAPAPPTAGASQTTSEAAESKSEGPRGGASDAPSNQCVTPCRAIASMRRSVVALCRLSGEDDTRCVDARKTLTESEQRVVSCGC
jgi:hypothetical protein